MSTDFPAFPVSIAINSKTTLSFDGPEELSLFCRKELSAWECLKNSNFNHNGRAYDQIRSPLEQVLQVITSYLQSPQAGNLENQLRSSVVVLSNGYSAGQFVYSQTPLAKFIQSLAVEDDNTAAAVYIFATRSGNENINLTRTSGLALAHLAHYYAGISKRSAGAVVDAIQEKSIEFAGIVQNAENQSSQLLSDAQDRIDQFETRRDEVSKKVVDNIKRARRLFDRQRTELMSENKSALSDFVKDSEKEIVDFTDLIKNKIALQGPTEYWQDKCWWHRLSTFLAGFVFITYLYICVRLAHTTFLTRYQSIFDFLEQWREVGIGAVALMGGILAVSLMLARVLYRLFASQLHLWNDASERVTMIQTYLALAEKGHAKEEFLGALLTRLFTPATDDIVRDDLGAIGPIDLASRLTGSRQ